MVSNKDKKVVKVMLDDDDDDESSFKDNKTISHFTNILSDNPSDSFYDSFHDDKTPFRRG